MEDAVYGLIDIIRDRVLQTLKMKPGKVYGLSAASLWLIAANGAVGDG